MTSRQRNTEAGSRRAAAIGILTAIIIVTATSCTHAQKPGESEFGLGPRTSAQGYYTATIQQPDQPLRPRKMQTLQVSIRDAKGKAIDGATITVDGGMPEHGHGLPTQPK